jgi:hypothetical protein
MAFATDFWRKVERCKHEWSPQYSGTTRYCACGQNVESHCLRCGVYNTEDSCGEQAGMSGWPNKRWKNRRK